MAKNKMYSDKEEMEIVKEYFKGELTAKELAAKYGFKTKKSILDKVAKYGYNAQDVVEMRKLKKPYYNFSLQHIDSVFKAYFVGLIMTDGYINENKNSIGIDLCDEDAISFLSKNLGKEYRTYDSGKKGNNDYQNRHRIIFHNKKLIQELKRFSITNNKSKTIESPKLYESESIYLPYIMRGIIDGNGWVRKDGKEFYICSASEKFAKWVKDTLEQRLFMQDLNFYKQVAEYNGKDSEIWYIRSALNRNINILKTIIYDNPYGMGRKYNLIHSEPSENIMEDAC